ncbi:MAG: hypothetical protein AB7G48_19440 [Nitrospiraceae bacterium]
MGTAIDEIRKQISTKEVELARVQQELDVLRRALTIMSGRRMDVAEGGPKIPDLLREVMAESNGQISADEIVLRVKAKGSQATRQTILGAAYRCAKEGRWIKIVSKGVFGTIEEEEDHLVKLRALCSS